MQDTISIYFGPQPVDQFLKNTLQDFWNFTISLVPEQLHLQSGFNKKLMSVDRIAAAPGGHQYHVLISRGESTGS